MRKLLVLLSTVLALVLLGGTASSAAAIGPAEAPCGGYEPYAYPPYTNGNVIIGIGGCGSEAVTVEIWKDIPGWWDQRVACCPRYTSPVTATAWCSDWGHGNYYTVTRATHRTLESERRTLC